MVSTEMYTSADESIHTQPCHRREEGGKFPLVQRRPLFSTSGPRVSHQDTNSLYREGNLPCGNSHFLWRTVHAGLTSVSKNPPHHPHASEDSFALWMAAATPGLIQTLSPSLKNARDQPRRQSPSTNIDIQAVIQDFSCPASRPSEAAFQLSLGEHSLTLSVDVLL